MRTPAPLPEPLRGRSFRVGEARELGVSRSRTRRSDLSAPFHGIRSAVVTSVVDHAAAYAPTLRSHQVYAGTTAARLWGLPLPTSWTSEEPLVLARPHGSTRCAVSGTRQIAVDARRLERTTHSGLPVLAPLATAMTLARELEHEPLVHVLDALLTPSRRYPDLALPNRPQTTLVELTSFIANCGRMQGVPALRAALADARVGVDSRYESITRLIIVLAGLPEPVVHPLVVVDGLELHPDLGYPQLKVAVEYEGRGHLDPKRWAKDILRYEMLEAAGWIVVRITKADLARDGESVVRRVSAALARRA